MATLALARTPTPRPGAARIYYIDEGQTLRAIHAVCGADGKYRPTGIEERISFPIVQAAIARAEGRPDMHPSEMGATELGAGGFRKKLKHAAKAVAHNKVLKKIAKAGKLVASFVPGASAVTASVDAAQLATKGVRAAKHVRHALRGTELGAVASAQQQLRASIAPTSSVAKSTQHALLRESRLTEASKVLARVPLDQRAAAAKTIAARVDGYKVITPRGNTVWVSKAALAASA
jgi:hypothetical protein